jgi:hypothetical protein
MSRLCVRHVKIVFITYRPLVCSIFMFREWRGGLPDTSDRTQGLSAE